MFKIGTFYKCFEFPKYQELEDGLRDHCIKRHIKGTIILTPEGINATISSNKDKALEDLNLYLNNLVGEVVFRFSYSNTSPFKRLKIKIFHDSNIAIHQIRATIGILSLCLKLY